MLRHWNEAASTPSWLQDSDDGELVAILTHPVVHIEEFRRLGVDPRPGRLSRAGRVRPGGRAVMVKRMTARRDWFRDVIGRGYPPCHLCGQSIDYSLRAPHPASFEVDHIIPLSRGGADTLANLAASHRACNRAKRDKPWMSRQVVPLETTRSW
jgi:5-methylcytosine-specific restriction endonuclease McrA